MANIGGTRTYQIFAGTPTVQDEEITFLGIGSGGDRSDRRRLIHPDPALAPITYFTNPDRTFNLDNEILTAAGRRAQVARMLDGSRAVVFQGDLADVVITETWTATEGTRASMPTFFFRLLYEYLINPPAFDALAQEYIQWEPRDRIVDAMGNPRTWNVVMVRMTVGGGGQGNQVFDVADLLAQGGVNDPTQPGANIATSTDFLNELPTGLVDRTVQLQFKIVNEATS